MVNKNLNEETKSHYTTPPAPSDRGEFYGIFLLLMDL